MVVIKTRLKGIPHNCKKCKYSGVRFIGSLESVRYCRITDTPIPMVRARNGNMKYTKPNNCPLTDITNEDG